MSDVDKRQGQFDDMTCGNPVIRDRHAWRTCNTPWHQRNEMLTKRIGNADNTTREEPAGFCPMALPRLPSAFRDRIL